MKKIIFLLFLGAMIGYYAKSNNLIPKNIEHLLPGSSQKVVLGASTSVVSNTFGMVQSQVGKLPVVSSVIALPQVQMVVTLSKNFLKIK